MQGFVWVVFFIKAKQACYPALLTVDGWFHFFISKGSENDSSPRYRSLKLVYVCTIYVCMMGIYKTILATTRSDKEYMLANLLISQIYLIKILKNGPGKVRRLGVMLENMT